MSMSVGAANGPKTEMNVTPMIDVLLVLIIIFMVITPLAPRGLETLVPQPDIGHKAVEDRSLVITALSNGSYLLNREPLTESALEARLTSLHRLGAAEVVFVRGDRDLDFQQIAAAVDLARGVGVPRIGLMP